MALSSQLKLLNFCETETGLLNRSKTKTEKKSMVNYQKLNKIIYCSSTACQSTGRCMLNDISKTITTSPAQNYMYKYIHVQNREK